MKVVDVSEISKMYYTEIFIHFLITEGDLISCKRLVIFNQ